MKYYGAKELAESFRTVRNNTIALAKEIPEEKYSFRAVPEVRSIAELLVHISISYTFQHQVHAVERRKTLAGFDFPSLMQRLGEEEKKPRSKAQIVRLLRSNGEKWAKWLEQFDEGFMKEKVGMPPGVTPATKSRFEMILSVKEHEMHHRGQLMLNARLLGMVPPLTREMQKRMATAQGNAARPK